MTTLGWVRSPDGRGTLDIIWQCTVTIVLCCWSSLCVNVPTRGEGSILQLCDKFNLACLGILGPEFLFALALGQYESARRSVKEFESGGYKTWTMRHAFCADMGGFILQVPVQHVSADFPAAHAPPLIRFPIDAKQLYYLVKRKYIQFPAIAEEDIAESDRLARFITIFQVVWFSVNSIARAIQRLQITTLELTTLAFIPCMITTSFCWYYKPSSIGRATVLECETPLADILKAAGHQAREPYRNTPLDFVSREEWSISLLWAHDLNILRKLHIMFFARKMKARPITRIPNDNWPRVGFRGGVIMGAMAFFYSAIFVMGWRFPFPTRVECILWRVSSLGTLAFSVLIGIGEVTGFRMYLPHKRRSRKVITSENPVNGMDLESFPAASSPGKPTPHKSWYGSSYVAVQARRMAAKYRNNSPDNDPALEVPLRILIPMTALCAFYSLFRVYFLLEDLLSLRALPPSAFKTVSWPNWFPHI